MRRRRQRLCARCDSFVALLPDGRIRRHVSSYPCTPGLPHAGRVFVGGTRCLGSGWPPMRGEGARIVAELDRRGDEEALRRAHPFGEAS